jgi:hypothetical protein
LPTVSRNGPEPYFNPRMNRNRLDRNTSSATRETLSNDELVESVRALVAAVEDNTNSLRRVEAALAARDRSSDAASRAFGIVRALDRTLGLDSDLAFSASEVLKHGEVDHDLALALETAGVRSAQDLGFAFRALRNRIIDGLQLVREGEAWALRRHDRHDVRKS